MRAATRRLFVVWVVVSACIISALNRPASSSVSRELLKIHEESIVYLEGGQLVSEGQSLMRKGKSGLIQRYDKVWRTS